MRKYHIRNAVHVLDRSQRMRLRGILPSLALAAACCARFLNLVRVQRCGGGTCGKVRPSHSSIHDLQLAKSQISSQAYAQHPNIPFDLHGRQAGRLKR